MTTRAWPLCSSWAREEKAGEEERREMVDGEGSLESVGGDVAGVAHRGQSQGGGPAYTSGTAGDQHRLPVIGVIGQTAHPSARVTGDRSYAAGANPLIRSQIANVTSKMPPGMRSTRLMGAPKISAAAPAMWSR